MCFQAHDLSDAQRLEARIGPALAQALGRCGGVAVLDARGAVLSMDAQALSLLTSSDDGTGAPQADGARTLQALLARVAPSSAEGWRVVTRAEARPLLLHVIPLHEAGTLVRLIDLEQPVATDPAALERVFGLTAAEARLAALLSGGASPAEAAGRLGVSLATVRKQLASIFAKTRTRGQVELVALVSRLACLP